MKVTDEYVLFWGGVFSQWYKSIFKDDDGITFTSCEQYMMYKKAELFKDGQTAMKILATNDVKKIKQLGREVKNFDESTWDFHKFDIVVDGNCYKFTQNSSLKKDLMKYETHIFVEASPHDRIWGIGLHFDDADALDSTKWRGQNLLGKALNKVISMLNQRNELLCDC